MIKQIITKEQAGQLIRSFVQTELQLSQRSLKKLKNTKGGIQVNGVEQTVRYCLQQGDILTLHFPDEQTTITPEQIPLSIVYEDDTLIIIEKPAGIPTIPSQTHPSGTLANGLLDYYQKKELPYTVHLVTRLDKDTSGLVLIAKHRHAHHLLSKQLQRGEIKRMYKAIVHGKVMEKQATIDAPIGRRSGSIIEREVRADGKRAVTHYELIKQLMNGSLVRVQLETGRTHQIRVHFAYAGHPLFGDTLYGGSAKLLPRQALHAHTLFLYHPVTGEPLQFDSGLPQDMLDVVNRYG